MLMPRKVAHRKHHRGRTRGNTKGGSGLNFGDYGIQAALIPIPAVSRALLPGPRTARATRAIRAIPGEKRPRMLGNANIFDRIVDLGPGEFLVSIFRRGA